MQRRFVAKQHISGQFVYFGVELRASGVELPVMLRDAGVPADADQQIRHASLMLQHQQRD